MVKCSECGKMNVTDNAKAYCKKIGVAPHCHQCQQKKNLNVYDAFDKKKKEQQTQSKPVDKDFYTKEVNGLIDVLKDYKTVTNAVVLIDNNLKHIESWFKNGLITKELYNKFMITYKEYYPKAVEVKKQRLAQRKKTYGY